MFAAAASQVSGKTISLGWADVAKGSTIIFEYKTDLSSATWNELGRIENAEALGDATFPIPAEAETSGFFRFRVEGAGN